MSDLRTLLTSPQPDPTALISAANALVHAGSPTPPDWTQADILHLVSALDLAYPLPSDHRLPLLTALKLLATVPHLNPPLYASVPFRILAAVAGLTDHPNSSIPFPEQNDPSANEARKIIANLILLNRQAGINILLAEQCLPRLLDLAKSHSTTLDSIFLIYRILFLLTTSPEHAHSVTNAGVDHYNSLITRILDSPDLPPPFTRSAVLSEILKTMFNLLSFSDSHSDNHANLFPPSVMSTLTQIFSAFPIPDLPMSSPFSNVVHVLMCGPLHDWCNVNTVTFLCKSLLLPELECSVFPRSMIKGKPYTNILASISSGKSSGSTLFNNDLSPGNRLPPLLHLLAKLYESEIKRSQSSPVAVAIKSQLIPADLDRKTPIDEGRTLGHFIIRLLTYGESANLREAAQVLIFSLCDKDPAKMVAHTGLGPSAGFLVNHGMLSEDILSKSSHDPSVNPITGQTEDEDEAAKLKAEWERMTDEEKEREAEQLFVKFERLNKLGVIKAIDPTTGKEIGDDQQ